jgi:hypothetical protein
VFSGVFIAEEVEGAGNSGSGDTTAIQILLEALLNMSLISASLMELFTGEKQNFWSWDYSPQMPDYH